MKSLIELISITGPNLSIPGRAGYLYEAICEKKVKTDQEAIDLLFLMKTGRAQYFKARRVLQNTLINHIITQPTTNDSTVRQAYFECIKGVAAYDILLRKGARKKANALAQRLLNTSIKYDFTEPAMRLADGLMSEAGIISNHPSAFKHYRKIFTKYLQQFNHKSEAKIMYAEILLHINSKKNLTRPLVDRFDRYAKKAEQYLEMNSLDVSYFAFFIILYNEYINHNYTKIVKTVDQALESFPVIGTEKEFAFLINQVPALVALKQYNKARKAIRRAQPLVPQSSFNWSVALFYRLVLCFHEQRYQEAYDIYKAANKGTKVEYGVMNEQWSIIKGFIKFLIKCEQIEPYVREQFRLGKFLNETPIFSKDKAGHNVNILIVQFLFLLQNKRYGIIIDKLEAMRQYVQRYLNTKSLLRVKYFVKLLLLLPTCNFHKEAFLRKSTSLRKKLANTQLYITHNPDIEIIPYEDLLELVIGQLETRMVYWSKERKRT